MRIPEKLGRNKKNLIAFLFLGVVLALYGWQWAEENGYFSSPDQSMPLISGLGKDGKDGDAGGKPRGKDREALPSSGKAGGKTVPDADPFGIGAKTSPAASQAAETGKTDSGTERNITSGTDSAGKSGPPSGSGKKDVPERNPASEANVSTANQSELMRIQADIMLLEAQLKKAKLQAELEKLETPAAPAITELTPEMLASLTPPSGGKAPAPAAPEPKARLIGVQGTDERMTATVAMPSGREVTVAVGDTLQGSRVRAIDREGLRLANGKRIRWE